MIVVGTELVDRRNIYELKTLSFTLEFVYEDA